MDRLVFAGKPLGERNLFWNFPVYNRPEDPARCPRSAMRRGDWKIHHRYEDDGYELYNLKEDIGESRDLAKTRPEILVQCRILLMLRRHAHVLRRPNRSTSRWLRL